MENKEFFDILLHLSSSRLKFPIIPTYFFSNSTCKDAFFNTSQSTIEHSRVRIGGITTLLVTIFKEYEKFTVLKTQNSIISIAYTFNKQKDLTSTDVKSILDGKKKLSSVLCLQKLRTSLNKNIGYCIKLVVKGIKYKYKFFSVVSGIMARCNDVNTVNQGKNLAKIVASVLLKDYKNPITDLHIDFLIDNNKTLWIKYIKLPKDLKSAKSPKIETVIITSSDSEDHPKKTSSSILRHSSTLSSRKFFRNNTDMKSSSLQKQLTTIINKSFESEQEECKEDLDSDSCDDEVESNFFEFLAREKFKKLYQDSGMIGKITPDNEVLLKEMKQVKKTINTPKLPVIQMVKKEPEGKTRKTLPYISLSQRILPSVLRCLTKN